MIKVEHEDTEELRKWGMGLEQLAERCIECRTPTRFWHVASNNPVCPGCAQKLRPTDKRLSPQAGEQA